MSIPQNPSGAKTPWPVVYISSPFAGDTEANTIKAREYCRLAVRRGVMPVAAHLLYPQFMPESEPGQRELGLNFAVRLLGMCDQLWVFGENISAGMLREIAAATECGMEIHYYNESGELLK